MQLNVFKLVLVAASLGLWSLPGQGATRTPPEQAVPANGDDGAKHTGGLLETMMDLVTVPLGTAERRDCWPIGPSGWSGI